MKLSILDYVPIFEGENATSALNHTIALAKVAEQYHYHRYWIAEHHQVFSVASSAPEMIMMSLLENTTSINIGSGGVMLPHYSAYKVAEQFKTMEARHPGRVDLGIGRSPSFPNVNAALNENKTATVNYEQQLIDLSTYFNDDINTHNRFHALYATPMISTQPSMYLLSTSVDSAKLAAKQGLPLVVALMGQPTTKIKQMIQTYKQEYLQYHHEQPPYVIVATFVITADTQEQVSALEQPFHLWLLRINYLDQPTVYPSIDFTVNRGFSAREYQKFEQNKRRVIADTPNNVRQRLSSLATEYNADEIMILPHVYGTNNRIRLVELLGQLNDDN